MDLLSDLKKGKRGAIAKAITIVENDQKETRKLLKKIFKDTGKSSIIGITGPAGAGKSSLINKTAISLKKLGSKPAVLAIDPTSHVTGGATDDKDPLRENFQLEAIYYDTGYVEISYLDKSEKTTSVVLEILGMETSFQKSFTDSEFIEIIQFPNKPKYGWAIHPIVLEVEHDEFGHVQIKTEIHELDAPIPNTIYDVS